MDLTYNHNLVKLLSGAIDNGEGYLENVPGLFKEIVKKKAWMKHTTELGEIITPKDFEEFIETAYPAGLGTTLEILKKLIQDDPEAIDLFDKCTVGKQGAHSYNITMKNPERGTSKQYAIRKLRNSRPDLHSKILSGELSANKAMIEAGFRKKSITVILDGKKVVEMIKKYFFDYEILEIIRNLKKINNV